MPAKSFRRWWEQPVVGGMQSGAGFCRYSAGISLYIAHTGTIVATGTTVPVYLIGHTGSIEGPVLPCR